MGFDDRFIRMWRYYLSYCEGLSGAHHWYPSNHHDQAGIARLDPPPMLSLAPIILLVALLSASVALFGSDASYGPNQVALIIARLPPCWWAGAGYELAGNSGWHGQRDHGVDYADDDSALRWRTDRQIISGTVPAMITTVQRLIPVLLCRVGGHLRIGLAQLRKLWTVAGTLGIGLMGIATTYSLSPAVTAGAVISGAYFGDKLTALRHHQSGGRGGRRGSF